MTIPDGGKAGKHSPALPSGEGGSLSRRMVEPDELRRLTLPARLRGFGHL